MAKPPTPVRELLRSVISCAAKPAGKFAVRRNLDEQVHHRVDRDVFPGVHGWVHGGGKCRRDNGSTGDWGGADGDGVRGRAYLWRALQPCGDPRSMAAWET